MDAQHYNHHRGTQPLLRRTGRYRTAVLLSVDFVLFAAINVFWRYLSVGQWTDFSLQGYLNDLGTPLGESLLHPLSILEYPWMILVMGLLLTAAIFTPIITSVFYPLWISIALALTVAVLGHAPLLSGALVVGCIIRKPCLFHGKQL